MKSKIVSLSKNKDFKSILDGKRLSNKYLTIFFRKLSDKDNKKLNISFVTKKKMGNAVSRNKIKRRLRNIMNDATKKINSSALELIDNKTIIVINKIDKSQYVNRSNILNIDFCKTNKIFISAKSGEGIDDLRNQIKN